MKTLTETQQTKKVPVLIAVTGDDMAIFRSVTGEICRTPCQNDSEGKIYFADGKIIKYLPQEWQPRLITKN